MKRTGASALSSIAGLVLALGLSCSSNGGGTGSNQNGLQQCSWPSDLNDAGPGACAAARALLECTNSAGDGCGCISNDPTSCAGCEPMGVTCQNHCAANQYAVACGGPPPAASGTPPAGCTFASANPGGTAYYCCPCN